MSRRYNRAAESIGRGVSLDFRRVQGDFLVTDPLGVPLTGSCYVEVQPYTDLSPGNIKIKQTVRNAESVDSYSRIYDGSSWSAWTKIGPTVVAEALTKLTADKVVYVRTDGNDANDGSADTAGAAFLTWQAAYNYACNTYDFRGYNVKIQCGGTGTRTFAASGQLATFSKAWVGGGTVHFCGDDTTPANVVLQNTGTAGAFKFTGQRPGLVYVSGFRLVGAAGSTDLIRVEGAGLVIIDNPAGTGKMAYGSTTNCAHIGARKHGKVQVNADEAFAGDFDRHIEAVTTGEILYEPRSITITGTPFMGTGFVRAQRGGKIESSTVGTKTGNCAGASAVAADFGIVNTFGGGTSFFPGNTGTTSNTSTYF